MRPNTGLVSIMYVNNETGVINDVENIGKLCYKTPVLFHTDCVQAAGHTRIDNEKIHADLISISAHKLHGVKGTGCLCVKDGSLLHSIMLGGNRSWVYAPERQMCRVLWDSVSLLRWPCKT